MAAETSKDPEMPAEQSPEQTVGRVKVKSRLEAILKKNEDDNLVGNREQRLKRQQQANGDAPQEQIAEKWTMYWMGTKVLDAAYFVGEVVADFFGLTESKYQYVVDAYNRRHEEMLAEQTRQEEARKRRLEAELRATEDPEGPHEQKAESSPSRPLI